MIRTFAAIDIGSSGLEMGIYEVSEKFGIRPVDQVRYPIALGKDTWHTGKIHYRQVDEMCEVLTEFVRMMKGYQVESCRAYATSALREAENNQIVADQIRELADQSAQAAVDTRELIEGSIQEVTEGNRAAERASNAIESVVEGIKEIADFSRNLKVMVEDQTEAMRQAEIGVNQISEVVQSNAATAEEASATSEELSAQANILDELVGQFVLSE